MDERFFATAAVALILALFFGAGPDRRGSAPGPVLQSVRAAPEAVPSKAPVVDTAVTRATPIVPVRPPKT